MTPASRSRRSRRSRAAIWREHHWWCFKASMERLWARPYGTLMTVIVMGVALALPLAFWVLLGNVQHLAGSLGSNPVINVYLTVDATADDAATLVEQWQDEASVQQVQVIAPDDGMQELSRFYGFSEILQALDTNPLPYTIAVTPAMDADKPAVEALLETLAAPDTVAEVQDDRDWRERLGALLAVSWRLVTIMSLLLGLVAALVVGNSIRLDIQSRAQELGVLKLVGASHAFVRRPYLYAGVWYGVVSGIMASALVWLLGMLIRTPVKQLLSSYDGQLELSGLVWWQWLIMPVIAGVLGWLGARLVSAYSLRRSQ